MLRGAQRRCAGLESYYAAGHGRPPRPKEAANPAKAQRPTALSQGTEVVNQCRNNRNNRLQSSRDQVDFVSLVSVGQSDCQFSHPFVV